MAEPSPAEIIRQYLVRMGEIRGTGGATKETSYYSAIENLLNQFGRHLKPKVICKDATALDPLRNALELALGLRFEGEEGDHFFKSTLIQTLFYGVFSAWVVYAKQNTARFD
jgi:hypothetical protein